MFAGRSEWMILLAVVAMVCVTILIGLGKISGDKIVDLLLTGPLAAGLWTVMKRADAAHDRVDQTPGAPPRTPESAAPPPRAPAILLALLLPLALASGGCASPARRFVDAYAQYRAEIGGEHEANLDRIQVLDVNELGITYLRPLNAEEKARRKRVHAAADEVISEARAR